MALLESLNIPLGTKMPGFTLSDPNGKECDSEKIYGSHGLLVIFTCNHCPYAIAVWPRVIRLANYAKPLGVSTVAINPNIHPDYPDDSALNMIKKIRELKIDFPYLVDDSQQVAKSFKAQCTPDIYLFNSDKKLVYHGRIDDNWQNEAKVTKEELKEAITALVTGVGISDVQKPSMGCSIKWRD